jgi:hypothetical protein
MIPGNFFAVEQAARALRRRAWTARIKRTRATDFSPSEWPPSRGPTPNPRYHD